MRNRKCIAIAALAAVGMAAPAFAQYTLTTLASFNGTTGNVPQAGVTLYGGELYGTTSNQGLPGMGGTVFSVPASGGPITTLASFEYGSTNGFRPEGSVILSGGTLYGTTQNGGTAGDGTVFSVPITGGGTPTTLATFNGSNGTCPLGALAFAGDTLYGTTQTGGIDNDRTLFSVPATGGTPTTLVTFNGVGNGMNPNGLIADAAGNLYGTTLLGGASGAGTVFQVSQTVPEPASLALLSIGAIGLLGRRRSSTPSRRLCQRNHLRLMLGNQR